MRQTENEEEKNKGFCSYMERGPVLSVEGLCDKHVAADGVDVVDAARWLIGTCSCDAVANSHVLVLIRADLEAEQHKQVQQGSRTLESCCAQKKIRVKKFCCGARWEVCGTRGSPLNLQFIED